MKSLKIKIHSAVDLITNSSTVIYTYCDKSIEPLKEMVDEMLKAFDKPNLKFDDIFYAKVLPDDYDYLEYCNYDDEDDEDDDEVEAIKLPKNYKELEVQYIKGEIEMQPWMDYETYQEDFCDGGPMCNTSLRIIAKDGKYEVLAKKIIKFLDSTYSEESNN